MDPFIHYGIAASIQALADAGLHPHEHDEERIGVAVGAGIGGIDTIEKTAITYHERGQRKISPFFVPSSIINMASGNLSIMLGLKGPNIACVTACTTATHNIGLAMRMIQYGDADVMIAGGAEYCDDRHGGGRLLLGARDVHAQRRADQGQPAVGQRSRRLRAVRRRRRAGARRLRTRAKRAARASTASWSASA